MLILYIGIFIISERLHHRLRSMDTINEPIDDCPIYEGSNDATKIYCICTHCQETPNFESKYVGGWYDKQNWKT